MTPGDTPTGTGTGTGEGGPVDATADDATADDTTAVDTVLLDVDGTLVDSNYRHVVAWQQAFARHGVWQACARIHAAIGMGGDQLVAQVAGQDVEDRLGERLRESWQEFYDAGIDQVRLLPGAAELVRELHGRGFKVVLASSGQAEHLEYALGLLDVGDAIAATTSSQDAEQSKPAGDIFAVALEKVGGRAGVVVGDSPWDVEAGAKVGTPVIALGSGGFPVEWLRDAGAVAVYADPADLLQHLDETLLKAPA